MRERDRQNKQRRKGFTLAELLVVVAIIGVLVGVAIPVLNVQLEKSREAVDLAHLRQALSAGVSYFITNGTKGKRIDRKYYNVQTGELVEWVNQAAVEAIPLYGKGTKVNGLGLWSESGIKYNGNLDVRDRLIMITCDQSGNVCCGWVKPKYAIRENPFTFLATLTDEDTKKEYLYPIRSKSQTNDRKLSIDFDEVNKLKTVDTDLNNFVNQENNSEEMQDLIYILEMYYSQDTLNKNANVYGTQMLALRIELFYCTRVYSLTQSETGRYFFSNTIFQDRFNDAEAVTLATQFWAEIAEYCKTNVDEFRDIKIDATTGATIKEEYQWKE